MAQTQPDAVSSESTWPSWPGCQLAAASVVSVTDRAAGAGEPGPGGACALGSGSAEVMDLLQAVDRGRDADLTGLELQPEEERVVPGLVQVTAREP